jgi:regulator of protease activity HflC (stomatin/prohibitin superfamily)
MEQKRRAAAQVFQENVASQVEEPAETSFAPTLAAGAPPAARAAVQAPSRLPPPQARPGGLKTSEELLLEKEPVRVRETGIWPFKRIIVPPNVYVVHTRIGRAQPVTLGMGISFRYNPRTDAYLIVPAAMQTIGIVANGISREKQGINVLAYVQWQIHDFGVAYRKLDFSDTRDPLGIVNAQLREQAEAAIKDKIATMSVEEVLTDKQPIIEELTARLKAVAEGRASAPDSTDEGLGIKIVTVQLKEALVSSQRLWEHLQAPFRYAQEKIARISFLNEQDEINLKELQTRQAAETRQAETQVEIERITQSKQTEAAEIRLAEENNRFSREQAAVQERILLEEKTTTARQESEQRLKLAAARAEQAARLAALQRAQEEALERVRLDAEAAAKEKSMQVEQALAELAEETRLAEARLVGDRERIERESTLRRLEAAYAQLVQNHADDLEAIRLAASIHRLGLETSARLERERDEGRARIELAERETDVDRRRQEVRNLVSDRDLANRMIERLPELAERMPEVQELRVFQAGGEGQYDPLTSFVARMAALAESLGVRLPARGREGGDS